MFACIGVFGRGKCACVWWDSRGEGRAVTELCVRGHVSLMRSLCCWGHGGAARALLTAACSCVRLLPKNAPKGNQMASQTRLKALRTPQETP